MAFNIQTTLEQIRDYIRDNDRAERCEIGHRLSAPTEKTYVAVFLDRAQVVETTLASTIELHVVTIRYYQQTAGQDLEAVELNLAKQAELILEDLLGDYDLGGTVRAVDVGGSYGTAPQVTFEWIEETTYRVAEITLPLIVDDSITTTQ